MRILDSIRSEVETGEYPSERPHEILEEADYVQASQKCYTGEVVLADGYGEMSGEEASEFLREFGLDDFLFPTEGMGFSFEMMNTESNLSADFDGLDQYRMVGDKLAVKASDPIYGFFPRYEKLTFELD